MSLCVIYILNHFWHQLHPIINFVSSGMELTGNAALNVLELQVSYTSLHSCYSLTFRKRSRGNDLVIFRCILMGKLSLSWLCFLLSMYYYYISFSIAVVDYLFYFVLSGGSKEVVGAARGFRNCTWKTAC